MSDASLPRCEACGNPQYACVCPDDVCCDCGCKLTREEVAVGRDMCFECYGFHQEGE
jgi:hypothetical protein